MPRQWQNQYTDLSNVNNGNELQNGDDILAEHVNVALENGAYVKGIADTNASDIVIIKQRLDDLGFRQGTLTLQTAETGYTYTLEGTLTAEGNYATIVATLTVTFTVEEYDIATFNVRVSNDFIPVSDFRAVSSNGNVGALSIVYRNDTSQTQTVTQTRSVNVIYKLT